MSFYFALMWNPFFLQYNALLYIPTFSKENLWFSFCLKLVKLPPFTIWSLENDLWQDWAVSHTRHVFFFQQFLFFKWFGYVQNMLYFLCSIQELNWFLMEMLLVHSNLYLWLRNQNVHIINILMTLNILNKKNCLDWTNKLLSP